MDICQLNDFKIYHKQSIPEFVSNNLFAQNWSMAF